MTVAGERQLREELKQRKGELRQEITKAIAEAREHGDLRENAEYHAAREQQGFNEGRIQEIEGKLKLPRLVKQIPEALSDSIEGVEHVSRIVQAMKELSREAQQILQPTIQLASKIAHAYDDIRQQTDRCSKFCVIGEVLGGICITAKKT